jgi:hypothetical protein
VYSRACTQILIKIFADSSYTLLPGFCGSKLSRSNHFDPTLKKKKKKEKKKKYIEVPFLLQVSNQSSSVDGKVFLQASIPNGTHFWDLKKKKMAQ